MFASGVNGVAGNEPDDLADDLAPLFEAIIREVRPKDPHGAPLLACVGWMYMDSAGPTPLKSLSFPRQVPAPTVDPLAPTQILVTNLDYDEHKGRIAIGRVSGGCLVRPSACSCTGVADKSGTANFDTHLLSE